MRNILRVKRTTSTKVHLKSMPRTKYTSDRYLYRLEISDIFILKIF